MKKEAGFTLIETLIAVALIAILSGMGISGWHHWQAQQRLWQTALQVRHFLEQLREEANWGNRSQLVYSATEGERWCLFSAPETGCTTTASLALQPTWPEVALLEVTPSLGFFGLRNTAWPGRIRVGSHAGEWRIIVSVWGRIRMCQSVKDSQC